MILGFLKGFNVNGKRKSTHFESKIKRGIKLHTIRWDQNERWKQGRKIHFATGSRTPNYNCFKEGICSGVQDIEIIGRKIYIDGNLLDEIIIQELAINDGFDSVDDFWWWFDQYNPFEGKLIHWSELRY